MPQYDSYDTFNSKISLLIFRRNGHNLVESNKIATKIVEHIRNSSGGGNLWKTKYDHGKYSASHYTTLFAFMTSLGNTSIPSHTWSVWKNRVEYNTLVKKFQTNNAIEAVNAFTEKLNKTQVLKIKDRFKNAYNIIKNDAKSLEARARQNFTKWQKSYSTTYEQLKINLLKYRTPTFFVKTFMSLFGMFANLVGGNEVTIGVLPLGGMGIDSPVSVTDIDVSHSNKIVKYRAVGSIYLAHQVGGKDSIKVTGKLQGPMRIWYLTALWMLVLLSQGYWQVVDWDSDFVRVLGGQTGSTMDLRAGIGKYLPSQKVDNIITSKPKYEHHITYPVVTQHEIIPNCYIETFSFEEKLDSGKDVITYDIMMRTFVKPKQFMTDKKRSTLRIAKQETQTEQMLKFGLNFTYRLIQYGKEALFHIDSNNWKVKNYYDLDAIDIAFTMGLAMSGVIVG